MNYIISSQKVNTFKLKTTKSLAYFTDVEVTDATVIQTLIVVDMLVSNSEVVFSPKPSECNAKAHPVTVVDMRIDILNHRTTSRSIKRRVVLTEMLNHISEFSHRHRFRHRLPSFLPVHIHLHQHPLE